MGSRDCDWTIEVEEMKENFAQSLKFVLADEGGNDDDPVDHGGRTSRGITQREYNAWRVERGLTPRDVWTADQTEVERIYHEEYWDPYCDSFPTGTDYLFFDMAVNAGPYRAATLIQRALHVSEDGRIGPITRQAIVNADPEVLITNFSDVKRIWYKALNQPKFTKGWLNRTNHVQANAIAMLQKGVTV